MNNHENLNERFVIDVQLATREHPIPRQEQLMLWAQQSLLFLEQEQAELSVRIVGEQEMQSLNSQFRKQDKPTNVLSFPADIPDSVELPIPLLGDIVICASVVNREAKEQNKASEAHWAHMVVHGILHLLGYDHIHSHEAEIMEGKEVEILFILGVENPYE